MAASKKIALNHTELTLSIYEDTAKLKLVGAKGTVKWSSSNKKVAAVKKGVVTAVGNGTCVIAAKHKKKVYVCQVTVESVEKKQVFTKLLEQYPNKKSSGKIVLAGGSNMRIWGKSTTAFSAKKLVNVAVGGSRVSDWKRNYKQLIVDQNPRAVILYTGSNDLVGASKKDGETVGKSVCELLEMIHSDLPDVPVYYVSILPSSRRWCSWNDACVSNQIVKNYCSARKNLYYIACDKVFLNKKGRPKSSLLRADGLHLNQKGIKSWNQLIAKQVKKRL